MHTLMHRGPLEAERHEFMKCAVFTLTMRKEKEGGRSEFWIFSEKKEEGAGTRTGQVVRTRCILTLRKHNVMLCTGSGCQDNEPEVSQILTSSHVDIFFYF